MLAFTPCPDEQDIFWVAWGDQPSIGRIDIASGNSAEVWNETGIGFDGIYVGREKIYCTFSGRMGHYNGELWCINRVGDPDPKILVAGLDFPGHPFVDWENEYIYWTENDGAPWGQPEHGGRVCRAKLEDSLPLTVEPLVTENTGRPQGIALDATGKYCLLYTS